MVTIQFAARHAGLSPHTIRAWEQRYAALAPDRTSTNRRLYSGEDLDKLALLNRAVQAGHRIGQIAALSISELQSLLSDLRTSGTLQSAPAVVATAATASLPYLEECLQAVAELDGKALEYGLTRAAAKLGAAAMIDQVALPLLRRIGESWRDGETRPAHEHMATAMIRTFLGNTLASFQPSALAPRLIVTTPVGQLHELGALIAAITAASEGWKALYLGPNLPAEEIAGALHQTRAEAVALSIVYPPDDPRIQHELGALRKHLGQTTPIFVGGNAAADYRPALHAISAIHTEDMPAFRVALEVLRSR
jgi:DNA-binding transcriptional MerR regulator/methylmalonyl-CoA mutase cobalamin-binding subunit